MRTQQVEHASHSRSRSRAEAPLILVIEDQPSQQMALSAALGARGYRVRIARSGAEATEHVRVVEPDVVILDLGLPDIDGLELCRHLRNMLHCPIIVVTADSMEDRIVTALDMGADDYILKPFSMGVFLARIRVALRHVAALAPMVETKYLECGDVRIDVAAHQVMIDDQLVELQARPFALLSILVRNEGKVVTYSALAAGLGGGDVTNDFNGLRIVISKLRKQIGTGPRRPVIVTELNVGYRLSLRSDT